ncbi:hypothetical protein JTE90_015002 [Oedothorax gibbosus]|uniref:Secreted protein n=1 Tax=Oedothorax gibbosus TaxID=931172 RepID=A0AAV6TVW0_9ARAC|nr:hypothetical protein JTE90_015002 [Oedothorax gibbosus]
MKSGRVDTCYAIAMVFILQIVAIEIAHKKRSHTMNRYLNDIHKRPMNKGGICRNDIHWKRRVVLLEVLNPENENPLTMPDYL